MKKTAKKCFALLLCVTMLLGLSIVPAGAKQPAKLRVALISDIHLFTEELAGGYNEAFWEYRVDRLLGRAIEQTPGTLRSALAAIKARALKGEVDYLLIPGDLTCEGETASHKALAKILLQFEKEAGIPVAVVPGNHDVNKGPYTMANGTREKTDSPTVEEFRQIYAKLGYDLQGNRSDFAPRGEDKAGDLSYAVDLGPHYRLVAIDTRDKRPTPELRAWVVDQCKKAVKAGKAVIGMGHHNLGESFTGHLRVINDSFPDMRALCEEFADAGMHFYFSGHMHMSEIAPWYSDRGEVLYDIVVPGLFGFPGEYRLVDFTTTGKKIEADARSYPIDEALAVTARGITFPQPYYGTNLMLTFGHGGESLRGMVKATLLKTLTDLRKDGGIAGKVNTGFLPIDALMAYLDKRLIDNPDTLALLGRLVDDVFDLRVSKLPCTRFIEELGFGDAKKPGTVEDAGNAIITYMFWKNHDPKDDAFTQDILRRMKNGDLIDQVLNFAVPKILNVLGEGILPLLAGVDITLLNRTLQAALGPVNLPLLLLLALLPNTRSTLSATLYDFAMGAIHSQSPSGKGTHAKLVYDGPVKDIPTGPATFRLPYNMKVTMGGLGKSAEIAWYTKASLASPALRMTDKSGRPVEGLNVTYASEPVEIEVGELDLGITRMSGYKMSAMKHTAKVEGLGLLKAYRFAAGDSEFGWWSAPQKLEPTEKPVLAFLGQVLQWFLGMWRLPGMAWRNLGFYGQ